MQQIYNKRRPEIPAPFTICYVRITLLNVFTTANTEVITELEPQRLNVTKTHQGSNNPTLCILCPISVISVVSVFFRSLPKPSLLSLPHLA